MKTRSRFDRKTVNMCIRQIENLSVSYDEEGIPPKEVGRRIARYLRQLVTNDVKDGAEFCHLRELGISFGVRKEDGVTYMSATFQNDEPGVEPRFNREQVLNNIRGRIAKRIELGHHRLVATATTDKDVRSIVRDMRKVVKPDGVVNAGMFVTEIPFGNEPIQLRISRTQRQDAVAGARNAWDELVKVFTGAC